MCVCVVQCSTHVKLGKFGEIKTFLQLYTCLKKQISIDRFLADMDVLKPKDDAEECPCTTHGTLLHAKHYFSATFQRQNLNPKPTLYAGCFHSVMQTRCNVLVNLPLSLQ